MIMRFRASTLTAAAALAIAASSSVAAVASEGLAPSQADMSKRLSTAPAAAVHVTRKAVLHKRARVASSWSQNLHLMLGVAY